ncbi:sulfatase [Stieleria varia]|nr:sulfatase [Stieleria varia]
MSQFLATALAGCHRLFLSQSRHRTLGWSFAAIAILLAQVMHSSVANADSESRPNVVLFLADDLGWTGLRCFGSDLYETPNLDALADSGIKFTNAYSACTVCSPTRASLMTGMYPARLHLTDFIAGQNRPFAKLKIPEWTKRLEPRYVTIAEALRSAGYKTGHIGKWHLEGRGKDGQGTDPMSQGFDFTVSRPPGTKGYLLKPGTTSQAGTNYLTDWLTDHACEFINESKDDPFFLYFAYNVPHTPIQGRQDLVEYFQQKVDPDAVHTNPTYAAMVASLDQSVGRVLKTLDEKKLTDNTLVIFVSDNGGLTQRYGKHDGFTENKPLRRGKGSAYEGGVRVPAIIKWPGVTPAGTVCEQPIMTIDVYPTLLSATGTTGDAEHNRNIDGKNIVSLLRAPDSRLQRSLFWHYPHYHAGGDGPYSAIRDGRYRLIEFHEDGGTELYDLETDLGEQTDLTAELPEKSAELFGKLRQWRTNVDAQMPTANPQYNPAKATTVKN